MPSSADSVSFRCANARSHGENNDSVRNPDMTNHSDPDQRSEKWIVLSGFGSAALWMAENAESSRISIWTQGAVMLFPSAFSDEKLRANCYVVMEPNVWKICMAIKLTFGHRPFGPCFNVFIVFVVCSCRSCSPDLVNVLLRHVFKV